MKKKRNIPKDFWKDFTDRKDFDEYFSELFKEDFNKIQISRRIISWSTHLDNFLIDWDSKKS